MNGGFRVPMAVVLVVCIATGAYLSSDGSLSLAQSPSLSDLLPGYPEGGSTVIVTNDGVRTPDEYAAIFFDPDEAAQLLADWGCQENVFRVYEDAQPTETGTPRPYLQVGITRFESASGAAAALPYVVQNLRPAGAHREIPQPPAIGDEARQFVAEVEGGVALTLLVRSGPLLIGISTLLTDGDPVFDAAQVAEGIIARQTAPPTRTVVDLAMFAGLPGTLPPDLPSCLLLYGEEVYDFPALVARFPGTPDAAEQLAAFGWEAGAYRQFACDEAPANGLNWVDMSVHQFKDAASAAEAVPYFVNARTVGTQLVGATAMLLGDRTAAIAGPSELGTELTLYLSTGRLLLRVTGIALNDDPRPETELVMTSLFLQATALRDADQEPAPALTNSPTPAPPTPAPTATLMPTPTVTAVVAPTLPPPTQAPVPEQGNCDQNYGPTSGGCVPNDRDYDCRELHARGIGDIPVIGEDWQRLDGYQDYATGEWIYPPDGLGCEWAGE